MTTVADHYAQWPYPAPVEDLAEHVAAGSSERADPSLFGSRIFPEREHCDNLDILIAGCGTNQAAHYAFKNPTCRVTGVDFSETSLRHEHKLKEKHKLDNLVLLPLDLLKVAELGQTFDYIVSSGVVHHLPDPDAGLAALRSVLRPTGVLAISVYSRENRAGVYVVQEAFRQIGLTHREEDVRLAMDTLPHLPNFHPGKPKMTVSTETTYLAGVVDLCLHQIDRPFSVAEFFDFLERNGLVFQCWQDSEPYWAQWAEKMPIYPRLLKLPERQRYAAVNALFPFTSMHCAYARHDNADPETYRINFTGEAFLRYVPCLNPDSRMALNEKDKIIVLKRAQHERAIRQPRSALLSCVDGRREIRQVMRSAGVANSEIAREFFRSMWEASDINYRISQPAALS